MLVKCAFFDFDDTIAHGDSIHLFLRYTLRHRPLSLFYFLRTVLLSIGYFLHLVSKESLKSSILFGLNFFSESQIEDFYNKYIVPTYYPHMVEEMRKRKEEGCLVFLVTASVEDYMKYARLPMDVLMGTKTRKAKIIGENCKGVHKVTRIQNYMNEHHYEIDYDHSYGYSDSNSDRPMLELVKHRYRVNKKDGSLSIFQ